MSRNYEYSYPVFVVNNGVNKSGHVTEAAASDIGLYDRINNSVTANPSLRQEVYLASGSSRIFDQVGDLAGFKLPSKSANFKISDVVSFERSLPSKITASNKVAIGFSGASCTEGINFHCDTNYVFKIVITGSPIMRFLGKPLEKIISHKTAPCNSGECVNCPDTTIDCKAEVEAIAKLMNDDIELSKVGFKARSIVSDYVAPTPNKKIFCLEVCDDGDGAALASIQSKVGNKGLVEKTGRVDCKSTYKYCGDVAAEDFVPVQSVKLAVCGTCDSGYTLVPATDTYIIVRPLAGTENFTTDATKQAYADVVATAYSGTNPVFQTQNGATASIQISVPVGTVVTALLADTVVKSAGSEAVCLPTTAVTPIAWTECGTSYKVQRSLRITLSRQKCGGADRLAELTAYYSNHPEIVADSIVKEPGSTDCEDCYTIKQWSVGCMSDGCLASDTPKFNDLQGFDGQIWTIIKDAVATPVAGRKCGLVIDATLPEKYFSNCSFNPWDFYEDEPMYLDITLESSYPDSSAVSTMPLTRTVGQPQYSLQSGEWLVRELISSSAYDWTCAYDNSPRIREALGQTLLDLVDRKSFYKVYYVKFIEKRAGVNTFAEMPRYFEPLIAFKEDDPRAVEFEKSFSAAIASSGVVLKDRTEVY